MQIARGVAGVAGAVRGGRGGRRSSSGPGEALLPEARQNLEGVPIDAATLLSQPRVRYSQIPHDPLLSARGVTVHIWAVCRHAECYFQITWNKRALTHSP